MKIHVGGGGIDLPFLISTLDRGEWSALLSGRYTSFIPLERRLGGLHSRSKRCAIEKNLIPLPGIKSLQSNPQTVAIPTDPSRLLVWIK
jgi:hypothetical protein